MICLGRFTNDYQIEHPTEHRKRPNSKKKASKNSGAQGDKIPKSLTKANPFLNIDSLSKKKTPKDKKKSELISAFNSHRILTNLLNCEYFTDNLSVSISY